MAALAVGGCGLSERPYTERRDWPLVVVRPNALTLRPSGRALLVRTMRAGPGLDVRGLQSLQPDGSLRIAFYEEWAVPPAEGVESSLRQWLAGGGLFSAVLSPGSRQLPDLVLESTLTQLLTDSVAQRARATVSVVLINARGSDGHVLLQSSETADAALAGIEPPAQVNAQLAALAAVFGRIESELAAFSEGRKRS